MPAPQHSARTIRPLRSSQRTETAWRFARVRTASDVSRLNPSPNDACAIASGHVTFLMSVAGTWQAGAETLQPMQALLWRGLESPMTVAPNVNGSAASLLHVRLCHDPFR